MSIEEHVALIQAAATITAAKIANQPKSSGGMGLLPPDAKALFKQTYTELEKALEELSLESPPPQLL